MRPRVVYLEGEMMEGVVAHKPEGKIYGRYQSLFLFSFHLMALLVVQVGAPWTDKVILHFQVYFLGLCCLIEIK